MLDVMSGLPTTARPAGIVVKTTRRVAVALPMSIGVGFVMMTTWGSSPSSLFLRTLILGLSASTYNFEPFFGALDHQTLFELARVARILGRGGEITASLERAKRVGEARAVAEQPG